MHKHLYILLISYLVLHLSVQAQSVSQESHLKKVTIYWDSSLSMIDKDVEKEMEFLNNYFYNVPDTNVDLIAFSNSIDLQRSYNIVDSDWSSLKEALLNINYDGVTFFDVLLEQQQSDINLLFTDGIEVIDQLKINTAVPTYAISSTTKTNTRNLIAESLRSSGNYINLNKVSIKQSLSLLNIEEVKTVDAKANKTPINKLASTKAVTNIGEITGTVYSSEGILVGATIAIKGTSIGVITDINGVFSIKANKGDVLVISYLGKTPKEITIEDSNTLDIQLIGDETELDEVVVTGRVEQEPEMVETGFGKVNKEKLGYAVKTISGEEVMSANAYNLSDAVRSKMGATAVGSGNDISLTIFRNEAAGAFINPTLGIWFSNRYALIVIDGASIPRASTMVGNTNKLTDFIDPDNVASISVLKGLAATNRYGTAGSGGVILITTKMSLGGKKSKTPYNSALLRNNTYTEDLKAVNSSIKDIGYIKAYEKHQTLNEVYNHYLKQRLNYLNDALYFTNVSDYIDQWGNKELSSKIRSNVLEINSKDTDALRFVAYKAAQQQDVFFAKRIYERIAQLKPNEAQSYRDLALIYQETAYYQKALDIYNKIQNDSYPNVNFSGLKKVINNEMKRLILLHKKELTLSKIPSKYLNIKGVNNDVRIVFEWNDRKAEFDLQFVNPQKKFFTWSHTTLENATRLQRESTQGFNTEEFLLIDAEKGEWLINVEPKLQDKKTPVVLKYTVYKNYGKTNETKTSKVLILNNIIGKQMIGKIVI
ncbi:carboxypeptidase-like regulatory domain-containing protein [Olleya sp. AH-315-F22]|nr:carboxypeptidase-like regulatory domain-containing protein [Olleya sp. AH-315-F22]